ncbi:MAG: hypothetical protein QOE31_225 [Solirubrobacteraceae bacterium]|jgi:hypothetical protein|nr:hypothetical protein [Solirubrobacteraceae bacterium]
MIRALVLGLALVALAAAPASAGVLSLEDATDLAQSLADAQEEQDVCYGWQIANNFDGTPDVGSSTGGPGVAAQPSASACPRGMVVLRGSIDYSCNSCDASDSASVSIEALGMADPPTVTDLENLGLKADALTGDDDDTTLVNMVNALPLLVADHGNAPYVEYEQATTVPATDHATGKPGSDTLRDTWIYLVLCGALIVLGPAFYLYKRAQQPAHPTPQDSAPPPGAPATQSVPPPT